MGRKRITVDVPAEEADQIVSAIDTAEAATGNPVVEPTVEDLADDTTDATITEPTAPADLPVVDPAAPVADPSADPAPADPTETPPGFTMASPWVIVPPSQAQQVDPTADPAPDTTSDAPATDATPAPVEPAATDTAPEAATVDPAPTDTTVPVDPAAPADSTTPAPATTPDATEAPESAPAATDSTEPAPLPAGVLYDAVSKMQAASIPPQDSFYVWNGNGEFVKFYTRQEFGTDAFKFAAQHADEIGGTVQ